jgi:glycosyltransferase 2 family protein
VAARDSTATETSGALAAQSRTLRNSLISLAVFFALITGLLLGVPSLRAAAEKITDAKPSWIAAAIIFELLSCAGYVLLFDLVFGSLARSLTSRLSLAELAVNSVVSVSGLAGIALGAWVLRSRGFPVERIARRSVLLFVLTSAVNVAAVAVIGTLMWAGILPGTQDPLLTLLPAAAAVGLVAVTLLIAVFARRASAGRKDREGRAFVALTAIGGGIADALVLIRRYNPKLLGSVGYWLFDNLVLYATLAAFGPTPSFWVVAMAYLVGLLANSLPIPGGFLVVEGGLVGMLLLFDVRPASAVIAAVVVYRAISLWLPALIGSVAFLSLRREIGRPAVQGTAASGPQDVYGRRS